VVEVRLDEHVPDAELIGKTLHQFHVETVPGAGHEVGVLDAEVAQFATLPNLVQIAAPPGRGESCKCQGADEGETFAQVVHQ
jgi:hypothetical protein